MGTHVTKYETKDGKTRRVKNTDPGTREGPKETAAAETKAAGKNQTPENPAKQGA
jgi:hypothetical protein